MLRHAATTACWRRVKIWRRVTTMDTRVRLYRWRIADLLAEGKPFIVVFGTPQHCTSCVDQLSRVAMVEEQYGEHFAFVHVDGYKDNAVWVEWGIKGEPWTFVVDQHGRVRKVFPARPKPRCSKTRCACCSGENSWTRRRTPTSRCR